MARLKRGAKSAAIREYLEANPNARPRDVVVALAEKGMRVPSPMVSVIKNKMNGGGGGLRGSRRGRRVGNLDVESLVEAKKLAERLGGIEKAQEALAALARLV